MKVSSVELKLISGASVLIESDLDETTSVHHLKSHFFHLRGIPTDCLEICCDEGQVLSDGQLLHGLSTDTGHLSLNLIVCLEGLSKDLSCCKSISKTIRNLDLLSQFGSKDEDVRSLLWKYAQHPNEDVARSARRAVFRHCGNTPEAATMLQESLAFGGALQLDALESIESVLGTASALDTFITALRTDGSVMVQVAAVQGLLSLMMKEPRHVPVGSRSLADTILKSSDVKVRNEALKALFTLDSLGLTAKAAAQSLKDCCRFDGPNLHGCLWALQRASETPLNEEWREILESKLHHTDPSIRLAALGAMSHLGGSSLMLDVAMELLPNGSSSVKESILRAFLKLQPHLEGQMLEIVCACLEDASGTVRAMALEVLCCQCAAQNCLKERLSSCIARASLGDSFAEVQEGFFEHLCCLDSTAVLETIRAHRHPQDERWSLAALKTLSFLSQSNQDEVLEDVMLFTTHPVANVKAKAITVLGTMSCGCRRSLEIFNHGLGDTSAAVRSASWLALSRDDSDGPQGAERMDVDRFLLPCESLLEFLQRARPTWSPKDLHAAREKLEAVHVNSTQQLKELLRQRRLNDTLQEKQLRRFNQATLRAFEEHLALDATEANKISDN